MTDQERWLAATDEERRNWTFPSKAQRPEKIESHYSWYRGKWVTDTCRCGNRMLIPVGKVGKYQCNDCADRAEGFGY